MRVITFGTFDLFHIGHLNILERASELGDELIVGVSTDELNLKKKGRLPIFRQSDRYKILLGLRCVDKVFLEESLELKRHYIEQWSADRLVMGDDWEGKFDWLSDLCEVIYLPRTESVSSTGLIHSIKNLLE